MCLLATLLAIVTLSGPATDASALRSYKPGFLDLMNYVPIDHFSRTPDQVFVNYKKWKKSPTESNFDVLKNSVYANPRSLTGVKLLFEASLGSTKLEEIMGYYRSRTYEEDRKDCAYYHLSLSYLQRMCMSNQITNKYASYESDTVNLVKYFNKEDIEARFVLAEAVMGLSYGKARELLEGLVKDKPNDYLLHTLLGINYSFGVGEARTYVLGSKKPPEIEKAVPFRHDLALEQAKKAISINPQYSLAYYLAYFVEKSEAQ